MASSPVGESFEQAAKKTIDLVYLRLKRRGTTRSSAAASSKEEVWNEASRIVLQAMAPNQKLNPVISPSEWAYIVQKEVSDLSQSGLTFTQVKSILRERMRRLVANEEEVNPRIRGRDFVVEMEEVRKRLKTTRKRSREDL